MILWSSAIAISFVGWPVGSVASFAMRSPNFLAPAPSRSKSITHWVTIWFWPELRTAVAFLMLAPVMTIGPSLTLFWLSSAYTTFFESRTVGWQAGVASSWGVEHVSGVVV